MNAYDFVENLINNYQDSISANELHEIEDGEIVLAILKLKYNAKYEEAWDSHFCGTYYFDNPKIPKLKGWNLYFMYIEHPEKNSVCHCSCKENNEKFLAKEILRLDNNGDIENNIVEQLLKFHCYIGKNRIWIIKTTMLNDWEKISELRGAKNDKNLA